MQLTQQMNDNSDRCGSFLDNLDLWLAGELDTSRGAVMQVHHDNCPACQLETRLARGIDAITAALPRHACPELKLPAASQLPGRSLAAKQNTRPGRHLIARLLATWRQPLVFVPAFAWVLVTLAVIQLRVSDTPVDPQAVIIDGQEYTRQEIVQATEDLEIALRYLDKYASYPARVVNAELEQSRLPLPPPQDAASPGI